MLLYIYLSCVKEFTSWKPSYKQCICFWYSSVTLNFKILQGSPVFSYTWPGTKTVCARMENRHEEQGTYYQGKCVNISLDRISTIHCITAILNVFATIIISCLGSKLYSRLFMINKIDICLWVQSTELKTEVKNSEIPARRQLSSYSNG